jgi:large subunit ribosomal protein L24
MNIKKKDTVLILAGKDKGKRGEVRSISTAGKVLVNGINVVTKHAKAQSGKPGGIQKKEMPLDVSNVALVCPKCDKAGSPKAGKLQGEKTRVCRKCGETII